MQILRRSLLFLPQSRKLPAVPGSSSSDNKQVCAAGGAPGTDAQGIRSTRPCHGRSQAVGGLSARGCKTSPPPGTIAMTRRGSRQRRSTGERQRFQPRWSPCRGARPWHDREPEGWLSCAVLLASPGPASGPGRRSLGVDSPRPPAFFPQPRNVWPCPDRLSPDRRRRADNTSRFRRA